MFKVTYSFGFQLFIENLTLLVFHEMINFKQTMNNVQILLMSEILFCCFNTF